MSSRSCSERRRVTSSEVSVIGVSSRNAAHSARENVRYGESVSSVRCSIGKSFPARRLFLVAGLRGALFQFGLDLLKRNAARA